MVSSALSASVSLLQPGLLVGQSVLESVIHGPASGMRRSLAPRKSSSLIRKDAPNASPYETTVVAAPATMCVARAEGGGSSTGGGAGAERSCSLVSGSSACAAPENARQSREIPKAKGERN